VGYSVAG